MGGENVYNPYDVLLLFRRRFAAYWFETEGAAMAQLREKGYADKYRHLDLPIHLIGVQFSRQTRNLVAFEVERG